MHSNQRRLSSQHVKSLDGVRGIAILLVLCHHLAHSCLPEFTGVFRFLPSVLYFGWCGVNLFFVLSGFLITGILLDTKEAPNYFRVFYARRILRIFPLYYVVLTAILLLSSTHAGAFLNYVLPPGNERPAYFVYLSNWQWTGRGSVIGHFWSLAVEEQFYLFWPLLVWLVPRNKVFPLSLAGIAVALLLRIAIIAMHGNLERMFHGTFTIGLDALLAGAAVACIVRDRDLLRRCERWIYAAGIVGFSTLIITVVWAKTLMPDGWRASWFFTCLALLFAALIFWTYSTASKRSRLQRALSSRFLTSFGKYSYGIYVYHVPILVISLMLLQSRLKIGTDFVSSILFSLAIILLSYAIAAESYQVFEAKFLKLKRFFEPDVRGQDTSVQDEQLASAVSAVDR